MTSMLSSPAGSGSGKSSARAALAAYVTTATAETPNGRRVRGLLDELGEIARDREMAGRFPHPGTWFSDLDREERDVWEHIVESLTTVSSVNTKEEQ